MIVLSLLTVLTIPALAQRDPVQWNFAAKKLDAKTYEIRVTATVVSPWHIYSQTSPDGGPQPTKITFVKNPMIVLSGAVKENGTIKEKFEEVFDVKVKFFQGNAEFVQVIKLKSDKVKTTLTGSVEYMVCTDEQCLPPATIPFTIPLNQDN